MKYWKCQIVAVTLLGLVSLDSANSYADSTVDVHGLATILKKVEPNGKGHAEAAEAMQKLNAVSLNQLVELIPELDGANTLAANWLRSAIDRVVEDAVKAKKPLPVEQLEKLVMTTKHSDRARRIAFEILTQADSKAPDRLLPKMIDDPSLELRRDSIAKLLNDVSKDSKEKRLAAYNVAFEAARDPDQVRSIGKKMRELGEKVDLPKKFGLVMDWNVIGPFDNTGRKGFDQNFPPEERIDLAGEYDGKLDKTKVKWQEVQSVKENGIVDLNKPLGELKEVIGYAYHEFESDADVTCQMRVACSVAVKVWVNDQQVLGRNIYASNPDIDQYVMNVKLKRGTNKILVKVLQSEVTEVWAKTWEFSLRVCDDKGGAILAKNRKPTPDAATHAGAEKKAATF